MTELNDMKSALDAMRKGTLSPQTYKNQDEITEACQTGKVFACKCHGIVLFQGIFCLILGTIVIVIPVVQYVQTPFPDLLNDLDSMIIFGVGLIVIGVICGTIYKARFLLVGPYGILLCNFHARSFVPWDLILSVEWKNANRKRAGHVAINTAAGGLLDCNIDDGAFSSIDTFYNSGITGLLDMIRIYFQCSRNSTEHSE